MEKKTSSVKHSKHTKLVRPDNGTYTSNEYAFMGTVCSEINTFYQALKSHLPEDLRFVYIDGDHHDSTSSLLKVGEKRFEINKASSWNSFDDKLENNAFDLALINGNHYTAKKQILFLDPRKADSIKRNIDKITDIAAIVESDGKWEDNVIFEPILQKFGKEIEDVPRFNMGDLKGFANFLNQHIEQNKPKLKALILGGGKSLRMGHDKTKIEYHGKPQIQYLTEIVDMLGLEVYVSKRADQEVLVEGQKEIEDKFLNLGPFGAICSAFMEDPNAAWLVLASDLPFLSAESIARLIDNRDTNQYSTALIGEGNPFPEPLIAIYEPKIYQRLLQFLSLGYACPRKVLINSDTALITVDLDVIRNINTPEEYQEALKSIQSKV